MARCPDCNKFVSVELQEPEVEDWEAETPDPAYPEKGVLTNTVRLVKACTECGSELEEANLPVEVEFTLSHSEGCAGEDALDAEGELSSTDRTEGKGRGAKTFYGAEGDITVSCSCGAEVEVSVVVEEQASFFESLG